MDNPTILYVDSREDSLSQPFVSTGKERGFAVIKLQTMAQALAILESLRNKQQAPIAVVLRKNLAANPNGPIFESAGYELATAIRVSYPEIMTVGYGAEWDAESCDFVDLGWPDEQRDSDLFAAFARRSKRTG